MRTAPLAGKCALITGSLRGLGLAAAQRLAAGGCGIVLHGLEPAGDTAAIRGDLERLGVRTLYCQADLRRPDEIERMIAAATDAPNAVERLRALQAQVFGSADAQEGARAFVEKRAPRWQGT